MCVCVCVAAKPEEKKTQGGVTVAVQTHTHTQRNCQGGQQPPAETLVFCLMQLSLFSPFTRREERWIERSLACMGSWLRHTRSDALFQGALICSSQALRLGFQSDISLPCPLVRGLRCVIGQKSKTVRPPLRFARVKC